MTKTSSEVMELVAAAKEANRWVAKAVANNLFEDCCVAPRCAEAAMNRLDRALDAIEKKEKP